MIETKVFLLIAILLGVSCCRHEPVENKCPVIKPVVLKNCKPMKPRITVADVLYELSQGDLKSIKEENRKCRKARRNSRFCDSAFRGIEHDEYWLAHDIALYGKSLFDLTEREIIFFQTIGRIGPNADTSKKRKTND